MLKLFASALLGSLGKVQAGSEAWTHLGEETCSPLDLLLVPSAVPEEDRVFPSCSRSWSRGTLAQGFTVSSLFCSPRGWLAGWLAWLRPRLFSLGFQGLCRGWRARGWCCG